MKKMPQYNIAKEYLTNLQNSVNAIIPDFLELVDNNTDILRTSDCHLVFFLNDKNFNVNCIYRDTVSENNVLFWSISGYSIPYDFKERRGAIVGKDSQKLIKLISELKEFYSRKAIEEQEKENKETLFKRLVNEQINPEYVKETCYGFLDIDRPGFRVTIKTTSKNELIVSDFKVWSWSNEDQGLKEINSEMEQKIKDLEEQIKKVKEEYAEKMIVHCKIFKKDL